LNGKYVAYFVRKLLKFIPAVGTKSSLYTGLRCFPRRQGMTKFFAPGSHEGKQSFPPIMPPPLSNPAVADHDVQCSAQCGAVHNQDIAKLPLIEISGAFENLKYR
jgi:hypothetical protein